MLSTKRLIAASISLLLIIGASGCTDEQKRDIEGAAVKAALEFKTEDAVKDAGAEVDGDLDCSGNIADGGKATGSCAGKTKAGDAIESTVEGTIDIDTAKCDSKLTITIGDEKVEDGSVFNCVED